MSETTSEAEKPKHTGGEQEKVPGPPGGKSLVEFWASHLPAPLATDNTAAQQHRHNQGEVGPVAAKNATALPPASEVAPKTPADASMEAVTGPAAGPAPADPVVPTAADTAAWLTAGAAYITGTLLTNMAAEPDGIAKNTALYCQGKALGSTKPRVTLEAIVPTHDSDERVVAAGLLPAAYTAWAWGSTVAPNVSVNVNGLGGYHSGTRIGLVTRRDLAGGTFSEQTLRRFLIHEVQHDADHHDSSNEGNDKVGGFNAAAWRGFKTEYRSYWADQRFDHLSATIQHTATHPGINGGAVIVGKNQRSFACINHLWSAGTAYQHIIDAYDANADFRTSVHEHNGIDSANLSNDPKIDDFVSTITSRNTNQVNEAWVAMDAAQQTTVRNNGQIEQLIRSAFPATDCYRVPLLGFVKGKFEAQDYFQASRFTTAIRNGNEVDLRADAASMGATAREFLTTEPDFLRYAEHYATPGNNPPAFTTAWNGSQIVGLLKNAAPPVTPSGSPPELHGCFAAGTPVRLASGQSCPIEQLEVGQEVLAYDEERKLVIARPVLARHDHPAEQVYLAFVDGLTHPLVVTANHRFFVAADKNWVALQDLTAGVELFFYDPELREASPRRLQRIETSSSVPVYNLSVSEHPSYFVDGILVHNMKMI